MSTPRALRATILWLVLTAPAAAQQLPVPVTPPAPAVSRAILAAPAPGRQEMTAHIDLDAGAAGAPESPAWLGVDAAEPFPTEWQPIGKSLKGRSANWIRLRLFQTGWVRRGADGGWLVDNVGLDRALAGLSTAGLNVILRLDPPTGITNSQFQATVRTLARRYGRDSALSVYRWEYGGPASPGYADFASLLATEAPDRPIGFCSSSGSPGAEAAALAALCATRRLPLSSFSWPLRGAPEEAVRSVTDVRAAFLRFPTLKGVALAPSFEGHPVGTRWLALIDRLQSACPPTQPNGLLGLLAPMAEVVDRDGVITSAGRMLSMTNRLTGSRAAPRANSPLLHCAGSRDGDVVHLLVWREDPSRTPIDWLLRLRGLESAVALRIAETEVSIPSAMETAGAGQSAGSEEREDGAADIHALNGAAEAGLRLQSGTARLITISRRKPQPLELKLSSPRDWWYAGELMDIDCEVRNTGRTPIRADLDLSGSPAAVIAPLRVALGVLPPGGVHSVRFHARARLDGPGAPIINVLATGDVRSCLEVRLAEPVTVALDGQRYEADPSGHAQIGLVVTNRLSTPVTLNVTRSDQKTSSNAVVAAPGGRPTARRVTVVAPSREPGCYPIRLTLEGEPGRVAVIRPIVAVAGTCAYRPLKPTIDGDLSEWTDLTPIGMGRPDQMHGKPWRGPSDLSAYAYLGWDEQFLYIACAVTDDTHFAPFPAEKLLQGDSVQFAVSAVGSVGGAPGVGRAGDQEFGMALLDGSHAVLCRAAGAPPAALGRVARAVVAIRRVGDRTFYEAALPWAELGRARAAAGGAFNFSIRVNDSDGSELGFAAWGDGLVGPPRPLLFTPFRLVR